MSEIREIGNFEEHIEIQKHLTDIKELKDFVMKFVLDMKNNPSNLPKDLETRIINIEAKQAKLWDLLTKESPQTKEPKLNPMGRRTRDRLGGLRI